MSGPGPITLRVRDADGALAFYAGLLGLEGAEEGGGWVLSAPGNADGAARRPGDGPEVLLRLEPAPDAPAASPPRAGLFHLALRVPSREALGAVFLHLRNAAPTLAGGTLQGASDHGVSRALYLADPEGNGLEIYQDRPREAWPSRNGGITMFTRALDLEALLEGVGDEAPLPGGTTVGHVHLRTSDLASAEAFWVRETGMSATERGYPGALFLAHGDYHHHLGLNVWGGPFPPAEEGGLGLARMEWRTGGEDGEPRTVRSPDGIEVHLRPEAPPGRRGRA